METERECERRRGGQSQTRRQQTKREGSDRCTAEERKRGIIGEMTDEGRRNFVCKVSSGILTKQKPMLRTAKK